MFQLAIQKLPGREQNANSLFLFFISRWGSSHSFSWECIWYSMWDWFWWFNAVIWYVINDIHIYVTSNNLTQPLSPQKMLVSSTNSQPKKEKTSKTNHQKKNDSGDSWMYPNQRNYPYKKSQQIPWLLEVCWQAVLLKDCFQLEPSTKIFFCCKTCGYTNQNLMIHIQLYWLVERYTFNSSLLVPIHSKWVV